MDIIGVSKAIGLKSDEDGLCYGIAATAAQAYLEGPEAYAHHREQLRRIEQLTTQQIRFMKAYHRGIQDDEEFNNFAQTDIEGYKNMFRLVAFLQHIEIFQQPHQYRGIVGEESSAEISQNIIETAKSVTNPELIALDQSDNILGTVSHFSGIYHHKTLLTHLEGFQKALAEASRTAMILMSSKHSMMLGYDPTTGEFSLHNHSTQQTFKKQNIEALCHFIEEAFDIRNVYDVEEHIKKYFEDYELLTKKAIEARNKHLILASYIYANQGTFKKVQNAITSWREEKQFIETHLITPEKVITQDAFSTSWLYLAAMHGETAQVQALIKEESKTTINQATLAGLTPLFIAAENGYTETVNALISAGATIDKPSKLSGNTPLIQSAQAGHAGVGKALIKAGASIDKPNNQGINALMISARYNHVSALNTLIDANATLDQSNLSGSTALHYAANQGAVNSINALIKAKASIDHANKQGNTPLFTASQYGHTAAVNALLDAKANINHVNNKGETPLMIAMENGHTATVKALLKAGADTHLTDQTGKTPLEIATLRGDTATVGLLIKAGAKSIAMLQAERKAATSRAQEAAAVTQFLKKYSQEIKKEGQYTHKNRWQDKKNEEKTLENIIKAALPSIPCSNKNTHYFAWFQPTGARTARVLKLCFGEDLFKGTEKLDIQNNAQEEQIALIAIKDKIKASVKIEQTPTSAQALKKN